MTIGPRTGKIRVLLVDDSATFRSALAYRLQSEPDMEVVGQAQDGQEAVMLVDRLAPDVVTMDVMMPRLDGVEASRRILEKKATAILLMSTLARSDEQRMALNALRLGVVDVINKPVLSGADATASLAHVLRLIRAAAEVEVSRFPHSPSQRVQKSSARDVKLIAIAASTGGPPAIEQILRRIPPMSPPVVIAQHLAPTFARGFAEWLSIAIACPVVEVVAPVAMARGNVYLPGERRHLIVRQGFCESKVAEESEIAPNADLLLHSVSTAYDRDAVGIILSGMGEDGAVGLKAMRAAGAWTIGQDRDSSTVYGMPQSASRLGACCEVLAIDKIGERVLSLVSGVGE
jgi:two-component system chemotaxis response regulator CheB